jgi:hypothetical protein
MPTELIKRWNTWGIKSAVCGLAGLAMVALPGCGSSRPADVPRSAMLKTEGDERLVYSPGADGTVWVTERSGNRVAYSGPVRAGDTLTFDPADRKLRLNGRVVADRSLGGGVHQVYFQEGLSTPAAYKTTRVEEMPRPGAVPLTARLAGEGGARVEYTAPVDGSVWVVDADSNALVYSGRLNRGETLVIDPKLPVDTQLSVAGRTVVMGTLPNHARRVYFQPATTAVIETAPPSPVPAPVVLPPDRVVVQERAVAVPPMRVERPQGIPETAAMRWDGPGRGDFVADSNGTVWVVNANTGRVVYSALINRGDALVVDPASSRLLLNTHPVAVGELPAGDRYRVFFARQP